MAFNYPDLYIASALDGNWERLHDDSSKRRIYVKTDMEMTTMTKGATVEGSHSSIEYFTRPA